MGADLNALAFASVSIIRCLLLLHFATLEDRFILGSRVRLSCSSCLRQALVALTLTFRRLIWVIRLGEIRRSPPFNRLITPLPLSASLPTSLSTSASACIVTVLLGCCLLALLGLILVLVSAAQVLFAAFFLSYFSFVFGVDYTLVTYSRGRTGHLDFFFLGFPAWWYLRSGAVELGTSRVSYCALCSGDRLFCLSDSLFLLVFELLLHLAVPLLLLFLLHQLFVPFPSVILLKDH